MTSIKEIELVKALHILFGEDVKVDSSFLCYVQPRGVKTAYRKKAKENHPDLFAADPAHVQELQTARLREIIEAYNLLDEFFKQRESGIWKPAQQIPTGNPGSYRAGSVYRTDGEGNVARYYSGVMPPRSLLIGNYLFYSGKISYGLLIKAVMWQREQRPSVGDIAVQWGLLDQEGSARISRLCGVPWLFGEKAVELGLLDVYHVNTILTFQRSLEPRLGDYFVQNGILTREEMERLVREQREHNAAQNRAA